MVVADSLPACYRDEQSDDVVVTNLDDVVVASIDSRRSRDDDSGPMTCIVSHSVDILLTRRASPPTGSGVRHFRPVLMFDIIDLAIQLGCSVNDHSTTSMQRFNLISSLQHSQLRVAEEKKAMTSPNQDAYCQSIHDLVNVHISGLR